MTDSNDDSIDNTNIKSYKIIFIGDIGVGKTSIINRILDNPFEDLYEPSIGVDYFVRNIKFQEKYIKVQLWDTAGQEKYKALIPSYVRHSSFSFIIYDISSKNSFDNIPNWINFIKSIENNTTIILCGNKIDLQNREVKKEEGEELAINEGIQFFEVSAKTGENIKNMFYDVVSQLPFFAKINMNNENIINELIQENEIKNAKKSIKPEEIKVKNIVVDGNINQASKKVKEKGCDY